MSYPNVTASGRLVDPPESVDHPSKEIVNLRVSFADPHADELLYLGIACYGDTAAAAATLEVGDQVLVVGYLKPIRRGNFRGHPEMVATTIAVIPETDDPTNR